MEPSAGRPMDYQVGDSAVSPTTAHRGEYVLQVLWLAALLLEELNLKG